MGASGSGKSTFSKLLRGFYQAEGGSIRIDGGDIGNLLIANPHAGFEDIVHACMLAEIHDSIEQLPECIELARQLHQMTRFSGYAFEPERIASSLHALIKVGEDQKRSHCLLLAENSGAQLTGCLLACIERHVFSDQPVASVITFGVLPQNRMDGTAL